MSSKHGGAKSSRKEQGIRVVADNRRARYDFELIDIYEAGIELIGSEVKSLRSGRTTLAESYATVSREGEVFLVNTNIPEYREANRFNHEPKRPRKLLLNRREINRLAAGIQREGLTVVPLRIFFNKFGWAKVDVALAKGKKLVDKRETTKERDWNREKARVLRDRG